MRFSIILGSQPPQIADLLKAMRGALPVRVVQEGGVPMVEVLPAANPKAIALAKAVDKLVQAWTACDKQMQACCAHNGKKRRVAQPNSPCHQIAPRKAVRSGAPPKTDGVGQHGHLEDLQVAINEAPVRHVRPI